MRIFTRKPLGGVYLTPFVLFTWYGMFGDKREIWFGFWKWLLIVRLGGDDQVELVRGGK